MIVAVEVGEPMCCRRSMVAVVMVTLGAVASAQAGQMRVIGDPSRDVRHTMQARKLLRDDPALAHLNVGVIVIDRVAVLWGPVPDAEAAFQAELRLRTMIELVEVRNELFINEDEQPFRKPLKIDNSPRFLPDAAPPKLPGDPKLLFGAPGILMGQDTSDTKKAPVQSMSKVSRASSAIQILAPEALAKKPAEPTAATEAEKELAAAIQSILLSKTMYRSVQFAVQDRRVYLKDGGTDTDSLHEAARAISRLPNVDGVILLDKTTPR